MKFEVKFSVLGIAEIEADSADQAVQKIRDMSKETLVSTLVLDDPYDVEAEPILCGEIELETEMRYVCTKPDGHEFNHIARGTTGGIAYEWGGNPKPAEITLTRCDKCNILAPESTMHEADPGDESEFMLCNDTQACDTTRFLAEESDNHKHGAPFDHNRAADGLEQEGDEAEEFEGENCDHGVIDEHGFCAFCKTDQRRDDLTEYERETEKMNRCKATDDGKRCMKDAGHESHDSIHVSANSNWDADDADGAVRT